MTDGFLSRWSRRKLDVHEGKPVLAEPQVPPVPTTVFPPVPSRSEKGASATAARAGGAVDLPAGPASQPAGEGSESPPEAPLPSLADAQALTPQSDFKPFMARGVAADVKNAAMKKLFADPHFNVMDRLDTYIDDYSLPDPIPEAMLRQMVSAKFLNLFAEEEEDRQDAGSQAQLNPAATSALPHPSPSERSEPPRDDANTPSGEVVAQSPITLQPTIDHDHTDMRLQPDHAPEGESPRRGAA
jgi:Protein of unknown function (DUF3306)